MIRLFKRRRPEPATMPNQITPEDRLIAALAGYTPEQWGALSSLARVDMREDFYCSRGLGA
jgi:hypothetical protein